MVVGRGTRRADALICVGAGSANLSWMTGSPRSNLLGNAFKYSPGGSPVTVELKKVADGALISVHDLGDGVPLAEQARIFDRFYRSGSALTSSTSGVGLGLYIARRLTEAMGGTLTLNSRPGQGSTFSVFLPGLDTQPSRQDGAGPDQIETDRPVTPSVPVTTSTSTA